MIGDLTLIESDILDELLEKAFSYDILLEEKQLYHDLDSSDFNREVIKRKKDFLSKYVNIPLSIVNTLEEQDYN